MDETFSSIDLVTQCLLDTERTEIFKKAIGKAVKSDSIVLDSGTGSGILSIFAAKAGAKKVYSLEYDPYVAKVARQNFINNGCDDKIKIMLGDARNANFEQGLVFNIVIMEMLTTGMIDEYQVWTINNLINKGYVTENTVFIPQEQETYINICDYNFDDFGSNMRMVKHLWQFLPAQEFNLLSETQLLSSISFDKVNPMNFEKTLTFKVDKPGVLNAIRLSSVTKLDKELSVGDTLALNAPVIFPLDEDIQVKNGDEIDIEIKYQFGNGFRNFAVTANKK